MIGESSQHIPNNLLPYILQTAIGRLKELYACGNDYNAPDGTGMRDYIDLATCHANRGKAQLVLGWWAETTLDDICGDTWRWQSKNLHSYKDGGNRLRSGNF